MSAINEMAFSQFAIHVIICALERHIEALKGKPYGSDQVEKAKELLESFQDMRTRIRRFSQ